MRPVALTMYGFGPFVTETTVEFNKLGTKGIFLVTGTTGAGKTSIFDAILYALYGKASGENRDVSMLKTLGLPDGEMPYVKFEFEAKNNNYEITRNLPYKRKAKKGDGFTDEDSYASISCNGSLIKSAKVTSRSDEVSDEVEKILGVNYKQYKMLSILPQGEFERFLLASTDERKVILQKLFDVSIYSKFQAAVQDKYSELYGKTKDHKEAKKRYLSNLICKEDNPLYEQFVLAKDDKLTDEKMVALIEEIIIDDKNQSSKYDADKKLLNGELTVINQEIGKAEQLEKNRKSLADVREKLALLKEAEKTKIEVKNTADTDYKRKPGIDKEVGVLEGSLEDYRNLSKLRVDKTSFEKSVNDSLKNVEELSKKEQELLDKEKKARETIDSLEKAGENVANYNQEIEKIDALNSQLDDLKKKVSEVVSASKTLKIKQEALVEKTKEREQASSYYTCLSNKFILAQAGIMAQSLKPDEACPVCGSLSHPNPASMASDAPTEDEVNAAQSEYDCVNKELGDAKSAAEVAKSQYENQSKNLSEIFGTLFEEQIDYSSSEWNAEATLKIDTRKKSVASEKKDLEAKIALEEDNVRLRERLKKSLPSIAEQIKSVSESIQKENSNISQKKGEIEQISNQIKSLESKLSYESEAEVNKVITEKKRESEKLQHALDAANKAYNDCVSEISSCEGQITSLEKSIRDAGEIDSGKLLEKQKAVQDKITEIEEKSQSIDGRININEACLNSIKEEINAVADINKQLMVIEPVAKTMNGALLGKEKVELETYVLQRFFGKIVRRANIRLKEMTNGNYELKVSPSHNKSSKTGLELSIIDYFSTDGLERDVHSLSGGEKFKAALSLALGMSDEISATTGGIKLDSLFIDEGFGSLDKESLESAIRIINQLTDGDVLVGIISHVDILKERINKQIVVTKQKTGSAIDVLV